MVRTKLLYILILAAGVWLCMLYTFRELRFLTGILLLLPFLCLLSVRLKAGCCRVEAGELPEQAVRGENVKISVRAVYRGRIPLAGLRVRIRWTAWNAETVTQEMYLRGMAGRSGRLLEYEFPAVHCGQGKFEVTEAKIYDCLKLFSASVKRNGVGRILVVPVFKPIAECEAEMLLELIRSRRGGVRDGDYFVREYRPGDSMRSVHWKLTAKEEELQVRDFEADSEVTLFLNMTDAVLAEPEVRDAFLDRAWSVMVFLTEAATGGFYVCWVQEGVLQESRIEAEEGLLSCIQKLIEVKRVGMLDEGRLAVLRRECHLEEDGKVYVGESCAFEE